MKSSLASGVVASAVLAVVVAVADALAGGVPFPFLSTLCVLYGEGTCVSGDVLSAVLPIALVAFLFLLVWPVVFAALTWGLPGESGVTHGALFGAALWLGYAGAVGARTYWWDEPASAYLATLAVTLVGYLAYGLALGAGYDYLAAHRTLFDETD